MTDPNYSSLLDEEGIDPNAQQVRPKQERLAVRLDRRFRGALAGAWGSPRTRKGLAVAGCLMALTSGTAGYYAFRPVPQPDYETGALDDIFNYTLLTDEFNNLPIEERLALIKEVVNRVRSMDGDDSVLLAAFGASIMGEAREQLQENGARLALDLMDSYALDYDNSAPKEDRTRFVQDTFINFTKTMEGLAGVERDITDEERLAEGERQAERDMEFMQSGQMSGEQAGAIFSMLNEGIGSHASPQQYARVSLLMRDMGRSLRKRDIQTGAPLDGSP